MAEKTRTEYSHTITSSDQCVHTTAKRKYSRIVALALIGLMNIIRPLLGNDRCRFTLTCTRFARIALQEQPLHKALWLIFRRVLSCNPFGINF